VLPSFVICLREGLEAALIVGIIAAFLASQGRLDALRHVWLGVAGAVLLCLGVGVGLHALSRELPQRQQEGLETVIGLLAVGLVTYMILWMRRHARWLKRQLEGAAAGALADGSTRALVVMAFLAVLREGFETAVFLLGLIQESTIQPTLAIGGGLLGLLIAAVLGYGIYRGGVHLDLAKFFRVTGAVLVIVAAGLFMTALRTAHEAGWLNAGQSRAMDLSWLVHPGTAWSALVTGVLGIDARPAVVEVGGWLLYAVPLLLVVLWPQRRRPPRPAEKRTPESTPIAA
jgi:high-affinity iron transporter